MQSSIGSFVVDLIFSTNDRIEGEDTFDFQQS